MSTTKKSLLAIIGLILVTTAALAAMGAMGSGGSAPSPSTITGHDHLLSLSSEVVQDRVLKGGDGQVTVALRLAAARLPAEDDRPVPAADLVIVLDRSGSMEGRKLEDARKAIVHLLEQLDPDDRLALLTYSNEVQTRASLLPMNHDNRQRLTHAVSRVHAGGGTNLGAGLGRGIDMLLQTPGAGRQRKVILISDGLANQGITRPEALGRMASAAVENRFSISTVGVGLDFNEIVMTAIADRGAGHYHFLEHPQVFARVFEAELQATRRVAAADIAIQIPLGAGVRLVGAGGYPISFEDDWAVIHPGNLLSGQSKTLYLTFQVPTDVEKKIVLGRVQAQYRYRDETRRLEGSRQLSVACVSDPAAVMASIKKDQWEDQVVQEEFSRLKEGVAADIRDGDRVRAQTRINKYEQRQSSINSAVGSAKVADNLKNDLTVLREQVQEAFAGSPAAVAVKKKQVSKSLQYESYRIRRDKP